jgi:hypothetical protein
VAEIGEGRAIIPSSLVSIWDSFLIGKHYGAVLCLIGGADEREVRRWRVDDLHARETLTSALVRHASRGMLTDRRPGVTRARPPLMFPRRPIRSIRVGVPCGKESLPLTGSLCSLRAYIWPFLGELTPEERIRAAE